MEFVTQLFDQVRSGTGWGTAAEVFAIVIATAMVSFIAKRLLARVERTVAGTKNPYDDILIAAGGRPMSLLIWLFGVSLAAYLVGQASELLIFKAVAPILTVGVISLGTWFVLRLIRGLENALVDQDETSIPSWDPTTGRAIGKLLRLSVIITATLVIMQSLGLDVSGALAFGGIGGLAVGMAAKDLLANFFGGLMLYLDRPIAVGEWVRSPDKSIEGTVEEIGWRLTRIRTFDKRPLFIPNSIFLSMIVENATRMSHRRIRETIGLRYDDIAVIRPVVADVEAYLRGHEAIDQSQTLMVFFDAFAPSTCDFFIYCFTHTTGWAEWLGIKQDVLLNIAEIIDGHGAEMAYPTQTVHVAQASDPATAPALTTAQATA